MWIASRLILTDQGLPALSEGISDRPDVQRYAAEQIDAEQIFCPAVSGTRSGKSLAWRSSYN